MRERFHEQHLCFVRERRVDCRHVRRGNEPAQDADSGELFCSKTQRAAIGIVRDDHFVAGLKKRPQRHHDRPHTRSACNSAVAFLESCDDVLQRDMIRQSEPAVDKTGLPAFPHIIHNAQVGKIVDGGLVDRHDRRRALRSDLLFSRMSAVGIELTIGHMTVSYSFRPQNGANAANGVICG